MSRIRLKAGDIFAVPRIPNGYHLLVFITVNQWGHAFGILKGHLLVPEIPSNPQSAPLPNPIYTDRHSISIGRWKRIGNSNELLNLFSSEPEIYHEPGFSEGDIGAHGTAQTPSGKLRFISKKEARRVNLGTTYMQIMIAEQLESFLNFGNPWKVTNEYYLRKIGWNSNHQPDSREAYQIQILNNIQMIRSFYADKNGRLLDADDHVPEKVLARLKDLKDEKGLYILENGETWDSPFEELSCWLIKQ